MGPTGKENGTGSEQDPVASRQLPAGMSTAGLNTAGISTAGMNTAGISTAGISTAQGDSVQRPETPRRGWLWQALQRHQEVRKGAAGVPAADPAARGLEPELETEAGPPVEGRGTAALAGEMRASEVEATGTSAAVHTAGTAGAAAAPAATALAGMAAVGAAASAVPAATAAPATTAAPAVPAAAQGAGAAGAPTVAAAAPAATALAGKECFEGVEPRSEQVEDASLFENGKFEGGKCEAGSEEAEKFLGKKGRHKVHHGTDELLEVAGWSDADAGGMGRVDGLGEEEKEKEGQGGKGKRAFTCSGLKMHLPLVLIALSFLALGIAAAIVAALNSVPSHYNHSTPSSSSPSSSSPSSSSPSTSSSRGGTVPPPPLGTPEADPFPAPAACCQGVPSQPCCASLNGSSIDITTGTPTNVATSAVARSTLANAAKPCPTLFPPSPPASYLYSRASWKKPRLLKCTPEHVAVPDVAKMTLAEKVGQMMIIDHLALQSPGDVAAYHIGSIVSAGGGGPRWGYRAGDWADLSDNLQAQVRRTRLRIPLVHGLDAVHGHNNVYGATIFPHHVGMGATRNPQLMLRIARSVAKEVMGTGVRWAFTPAVSVCQDPRWGRCYESFSSDTGVVTPMSRSEVLGFQYLSGDCPSLDPAKGTRFIGATAKHFVGDGGTASGIDRGNTRGSWARIKAVNVPPFASAIQAGVASIMVSYSSINGVPMHQNRYLLTNVLRSQLGFKGVLVSDWKAVQLLPGDFTTQVMKAINAGIDVVMVPGDYKGFASNLTYLVQQGMVPMARIDEAVGRVLAMKASLGLFRDACAQRKYLAHVGSPAHRGVAREAVRESLVLLKNVDLTGNMGAPLFPLQLSNKRVLIAGQHANDIGLQCGGWTITWQGKVGNTTIGTTILEGFRDVISRKHRGARVVYQKTYDGYTEADVGILVVGEHPYTEYEGDSKRLTLNGTTVWQAKKMCARMRCVMVLVAGRSLDVTPLLPILDGLVMAWLPGTEGAGVADVIAGGHDFRGRLPFNWFRTVSQLPLTAPGRGKPLFPEGFGLNKAGRSL